MVEKYLSGQEDYEEKQERLSNEIIHSISSKTQYKDKLDMKLDLRIPLDKLKNKYEKIEPVIQDEKPGTPKGISSKKLNDREGNNIEEQNNLNI